MADLPRLDELVRGADSVISMPGDVQLQKEHQINTALVRNPIPALRRPEVKRFLHQAGACGLVRKFVGVQIQAVGH